MCKDPAVEGSWASTRNRKLASDTRVLRSRGTLGMMRLEKKQSQTPQDLRGLAKNCDLYFKGSETIEAFSTGVSRSRETS